jgi:glycosyltransferase involved in cell wall biosynthesis
MRVLIVHNQLWAHYKSKLFSELHQLSASQNIDIQVVHIALAEKSRANMGSAEAIKYTYNYKVLFKNTLENVPLWPKIKALFREIHTQKPDVLNITGYYDPAQLLLMFYAKIRGIKVIISNESGSDDHQRHWLKENLKRFVLGLANGFFCFGTTSANYLTQLGVPQSRILTRHAAIVDNDILLAQYQKAFTERNKQKNNLILKPFNFIFVGRLIPPKNLRLLIEAFANIQTANPDWGLMLLGNGEQKPELVTFCEQKQLDSVVFIDPKPWYEVPQYLALADVLVLPSTSEPWGLVVNEAMVCGLPVLVSDKCGCATDLVQNNGQVFDSTSLEDLTQKLMWFVQHSNELTAMGANSTHIIAKFHPQTVANEMLRGFLS